MRCDVGRGWGASTPLYHEVSTDRLEQTATTCTRCPTQRLHIVPDRRRERGGEEVRREEGRRGGGRREEGGSRGEEKARREEGGEREEGGGGIEERLFCPL